MGIAPAIESLHRERPLTGRLREDAERLVDAFGELFRFAAEHGPPALGEEARARGRRIAAGSSWHDA